MAKLTAQQIAEKHARRTKAAVEDMRQGIQAVTQSPTSKAASKKTKMLTNLTEAVNSGKWERGLQAVTLQQWQAAALEKGVGRVAAGVDNSMQKTEQFYNKLIPFQDALVAQIKSMPDASIDDSINRMAAYARGMQKFKK